MCESFGFKISMFCWAQRMGGRAGQLVPIKLGSLRIPCVGIRAGPSPILEAWEGPSSSSH